jgi:hypothetical protein
MEERLYLNTDNASQYVENKFGRPCSANLLTKLASQGGGPKHVKIGRFRAYAPQWLDEWVLPQITKPRHSTSDEPSRKGLSSASDRPEAA